MNRWHKAGAALIVASVVMMLAVCWYWAIRDEVSTRIVGAWAWTAGALLVAGFVSIGVGIGRD